ncbi:hypothetical protein BDV28DRAFT_132410 [Aspergillus coremiiformis]|uniref:Uncharacterized protein n=1 Tax=Aspergillus coremiiformis TaxID=138285 RepID=A0A5N6ZCI3_9EURO|nr:hypothetical protein BDV28DRAFT_132410 [Aspergillus coremiiformis]
MLDEMALNRGGGSSSSQTASCSRAAFRTHEAQVVIAFHALFFLVFSALFCIASFKLIRSTRKETAVRQWFPLGFSIAFMILAVIINIVLFTLLQCDISSIRVYGVVSILAEWFGGLATFLLIALIMITICTRLLQGNKKISKMVTIVHTSYVGLLAILLLCNLAIYTRIMDASDRKSLGPSDWALPGHKKRFAMAYNVCAVIGMVMAAANMLFALAHGWHLRKGILFGAVVLLMVSSLGLTILDLATHIILHYLQDQYLRKDVAAYNRSLEAQLFLSYFFYASTFLAALVVASSHQLADIVSPAPVKHLQQEPKYNDTLLQSPYQLYQPGPYQYQYQYQIQGPAPVQHRYSSYSNPSSPHLR